MINITCDLDAMERASGTNITEVMRVNWNGTIGQIVDVSNSRSMNHNEIRLTIVFDSPVKPKPNSERHIHSVIK